MNRVLAVLFLLGVPLLATAQDLHFGLGLSATVNDTSKSQTGYSDYTSTSSTVGGVVLLSLDKTWETDLGLAVISETTKDAGGLVTTAGTDYSQGGLVFGLGISGAFADVGPLTFRAGVAGQLGYLGPPDGYVGDYSFYFGSLSLPLSMDITFGEKWGFRVSQTVVRAYFQAESASNIKYGSTSFVVNGYIPTVSLYYMF